VPEPGVLSRQDWEIAIGHMDTVVGKRTGKPVPEADLRSVLAYYRPKSAAVLAKLPPDPVDSPVRFEWAALGREAIVFADPGEPGPSIVNVNVTDLDQDGRADVLVCEDIRRTVSWIHREGDGWVETVLAVTGTPGRTQVYDHDKDGDLDVLVAVLGGLLPSEQLVGAVVLLENQGGEHFAARTLVTGLPRTSDARAADLDGDGDFDVVVAGFGFINAGEISWFEQRGKHEWVRHVVQQIPGAIHVPVVDLDRDGDMDFVALIAQDSEKVVAFLNDGHGVFAAQEVWAAGTPTFGAAGLEMADLDRDGDTDFVLVNGDAFDLRGYGPRPYHGVSWLEQRGPREWVRHEIMKLHGAYGTAVGDLDGDGDLDLAAVSMFNLWEDPARQSVLWAENDGKQGFTAHGLGSAPIHQVTVSIGDLDGDGRADLVTGGLHKLSPPQERIARVNAWWNRGKK
jgi:hypothetical protein